MVSEDVTLDEGHMMQFECRLPPWSDDVLWKCILEIYVILLTIVTPISLFKKYNTSNTNIY